MWRRYEWTLFVDFIEQHLQWWHTIQSDDIICMIFMKFDNSIFTTAMQAQTLQRRRTINKTTYIMEDIRAMIINNWINEFVWSR